MVFSSITFLFFYLPLVVLLTWVAPARFRNAVLLVASLVFYAWGSDSFVLVLVGTSLLDFVFVRLGHRAGRRRRRGFLLASIVLNLGVLAYFKYAGFLSNDVFGALFGLGDPPDWLGAVVLPIGISFFTFQRLSYSVDVLTDREDPIERFFDYLLYITLFPQLIAGPIVRYSTIRAQLLERTLAVDRIADGVVRFSFGLCKKIIVADTLAGVADLVFDPSIGRLTTSEAALGTVAYTLQLYFDFSGYSDMAIGLGMMLGFTLPENFDRPYTATSVTEFWRRWHMTLSQWFRDYLYIPLGGNRTGHTYRNLILVFLLTGLWHGAAWTFVIWGAYHGIWLLIERRAGGRLLSGLPGRALTLAIVAVGWIVFRAPDFNWATEVFSALFRFEFGTRSGRIANAVDTRFLLVLLGASIVFFMPSTKRPGPPRLHDPGRLAAAARSGLLVVGLPIALVLAAAQTFSPFLYFQF